MQSRFKLGALAWGIAAAMAFPAGAAASSASGILTLPTGNNSAVCNQLATANTNAANQCRQENTATNTQSATATAGAGGTATGGNAGPVQVVGNGSQGGSYGGNANANGGDAEAHNSLENEQSNQISGRDSSSESYVGEGNNNSDICKQLATGNTQGNDQCHQSDTATNTQSATATGGAGGSATGGNAGPVQVVGDDSEGGSLRRQRVRERRRRRGAQQPRKRAVQPDLRARQLLGELRRGRQQQLRRLQPAGDRRHERRQPVQAGEHGHEHAVGHRDRWRRRLGHRWQRRTRPGRR